MRAALPARRLIAATVTLVLAIGAPSLAPALPPGPPPAIAAGAAGASGGGGPGTTHLPTMPLLPDLGQPGIPNAGGLPPGDAPHEPDLLIVVFRPGTSDGTAAEFANGFKLKIERQYDLSGLHLRVFLMRIPAGGDLPALLRQASSDSRALWVQLDLGYRSLDDGATTGGRQYALHRIHAEALPASANGRGVTIALIDSGVARSHESLAADDITSIDLVDGGTAPPAETHGTALASIIAGAGKVKGLAPGAKLLAIRAFKQVDAASGESSSDSFRVSEAISLALDRHARIINLSIGGPDDRLVRMAIVQAVLTGTVVIAAAGNEGPNAPPVYPAAQTGVIAVTATDAKDRVYPGANRGDYIAVAAPGVDVYAARPGAGGGSAYDFFTGTSMATGTVTGLAAVLLSADPKLNVADLQHILESTAQDLGAAGKDPVYGWGRIDAAAAFAQVPTVGAQN
jgi:subtilisin family serine protease